MKFILFALAIISSLSAMAQYDRAVVSLTRLDYVYYNIDNPMSVAVPGLLPQDIEVSVGEDRAFLNRDPDGSNRNDLLIRPKDSTGTITVHIDERIDPNRTRSRGILRFRVLTLPNPTLYLGYVHQGDTVKLNDLLTKGYIQVKALYDDFNFPISEPQVLSYQLNRSRYFNLPIEVEGSKLTTEVKEMLSQAHLDETIYLENVRVRLPDDRIVTLKAEFPLK